MLIEAIDKPMCYRWPEGEVQLVPGQPVDLPESRALRLLQRAPGKVRAVSAPSEAPAPPLQPGWLVVYRNQHGALCGGCDDRVHGTVEECRREAGSWTVTLTDGQTMPLSQIRSVGAVDHKGRLYGAWAVREHGYDGNGQAGSFHVR